MSIAHPPAWSSDIPGNFDWELLSDGQLACLEKLDYFTDIGRFFQEPLKTIFNDYLWKRYSNGVDTRVQSVNDSTKSHVVDIVLQKIQTSSPTPTQLNSDFQRLIMQDLLKWFVPNMDNSGSDTSYYFMEEEGRSDAMESFVNSWILTPENTAILLGAIINSYTLPHSETWHLGIIHLDNVLLIIELAKKYQIQLDMSIYWGELNKQNFVKGILEDETMEIALTRWDRLKAYLERLDTILWIRFTQLELDDLLLWIHSSSIEHGYLDEDEPYDSDNKDSVDFRNFLYWYNSRLQKLLKNRKI